jgi:hypothetical protein
MSRWIRWIGFGLLSLWMLQPIELWIDVDGSLQPSVQRFVFAPCDGYIEEFAARDGETLSEVLGRHLDKTLDRVRDAI